MTLTPFLWGVIGISLIVFEMFSLGFVSLWFGVSALLLGGLLWLIPMTMTVQLGLYAVLSLGLTVSWFKWINPLLTQSKSPQHAKEDWVGKCGVIIDFNPATLSGKIRFVTPVLGSTEWAVVSDSVLVLGDRAEIIDVSGNQLMVQKK